MAAITFGSVGDIIAVCQVIKTTIHALSTSRGSAAEYQSLTNSLWSLSQALESVKSLLEKSLPMQHRGRLNVALQNCIEYLDRELDRIQKFAFALRRAGSGNRTIDAFWKLRWQGHKVPLPRHQLLLRRVGITNNVRMI